MPYYAALISLLTNPPNAPPPSSASGEAEPKEEEAGEKETVGRIVMTDLVRGFKKSVDERKWREIRLMVSFEKEGKESRASSSYGKTTLTLWFVVVAFVDPSVRSPGHHRNDLRSELPRVASELPFRRGRARSERGESGEGRRLCRRGFDQGEFNRHPLYSSVLE